MDTNKFEAKQRSWLMWNESTADVELMTDKHFTSNEVFIFLSFYAFNQMSIKKSQLRDNRVIIRDITFEID